MFSKKVMLPLVAGVLMLGACSSQKNLQGQQVLDKIVPAMCKKMSSCSPDVFPAENVCQDTMKQVLNQAFANNKDLEAKLQTTEKDLDNCVKAIEKQECAALQENPPPECSFLAKIN